MTTLLKSPIKFLFRLRNRILYTPKIMKRAPISGRIAISSTSPLNLITQLVLPRASLARPWSWTLMEKVPLRFISIRTSPASTTLEPWSLRICVAKVSPLILSSVRSPSLAKLLLISKKVFKTSPATMMFQVFITNRTLIWDSSSPTGRTMSDLVWD